jgi:HTH-type transcriptional regulator/antitoxin HipB
VLRLFNSMRSHGTKRKNGEPEVDVALRQSERMGAAIRLRRRALRLTQQQLGALAGCGLAFLYQVERGKTTVRLDKLLAVLRVLGMALALEDGKDTLRIAAQYVEAPAK